MSEKITYDVSGGERITAILMQLLNEFPLLEADEEIAFSTLDESYGKAMFPISGAIIETEIEDITGMVEQRCLYPFVVIYRGSPTSEKRKIDIKQWLDMLGQWLERQWIDVDNLRQRIDEYPKLADDQEIISITRQTPAFLESINENQTEDWQIHISAIYSNKFCR